MEMMGYSPDQYPEMLEQAYLRAPRQVHIADWLAPELYAKTGAEYFASVEQPLLMELTDENEYQQIKSMLAEMQTQSGSRQLSVKLSPQLARKNSAILAKKPIYSKCCTPDWHYPSDRTETPSR